MEGIPETHPTPKLTTPDPRHVEQLGYRNATEPCPFEGVDFAHTLEQRHAELTAPRTCASWWCRATFIGALTVLVMGLLVFW